MTDFKETWKEGSYLYTRNKLTGEVSRTVIDYSIGDKKNFEFRDLTPEEKEIKKERYKREKAIFEATHPMSDSMKETIARLERELGLD